MSIQVAIADDEPLARRRLLRFLKDVPDAEVVAECGDGQAALAALAKGGIDLLFLDVQMPGMDGFEVVAAHVAAHGAEKVPATVFVTAYDEYAIRAFDAHALDYLLKPVTAERFDRAFKRAREHLERVASVESRKRLVALLSQVLEGEGAAQALAGAAGLVPPSASGTPPAAPATPALSTATSNGGLAAPAPGHTATRIVVRHDGRVYFVRTADVDWFEADGNYVKVHAGRQVHVIRETIGALEAQLDRAQFARIHRSTVVNLDRIQELQPWFAGDYVVLLRDGTKLKLSRTYREQLQERLQALR
jgi:two-component system LytT family response regulator